MDEEIREKLDFFWDDCEPEIEADVVDSIREKVLRRIRPLQEEAVGLPKRKSRKCVYLLVASVAASEQCWSVCGRAMAGKCLMRTYGMLLPSWSRFRWKRPRM